MDADLSRIKSTRGGWTSASRSPQRTPPLVELAVSVDTPSSVVPVPEVPEGEVDTDVAGTVISVVRPVVLPDVVGAAVSSDVVGVPVTPDVGDIMLVAEDVNKVSVAFEVSSGKFHQLGHPVTNKRQKRWRGKFMRNIRRESVWHNSRL